MAEESIPLTERATLTADQSAALDAVAEIIESECYDPDKFRARFSCVEETCEVDVFPEELETEQYAGWRGCPLKYCATIVFSTKTNEVIKTTYWR